MVYLKHICKYVLGYEYCPWSFSSKGSDLNYFSSKFHRLMQSLSYPLRLNNMCNSNFTKLKLGNNLSDLIGVFNLICTTNLNEHFKLLKSSLKIKIYVIPGSRSEFKMRLMKFKHQGSDLSDPFQFQYIPLLQDVEKHKSCNC